MNQLDPKFFYFELPLYAKISISETNIRDLEKLMSFDGEIDFYNSQLTENTTYKFTSLDSEVIEGLFTGSSDSYIERYYYKGGYSYAIAKCLRTNKDYRIYTYYDIENKIFQKIGQYPSIADFHISQIKKYNKVLDNDKLKEFTKAIGLAANGVGIGSFVYLRRIFENLIEEAHNKAKVLSGWDDEIYNKQRMAERIEMLKEHLPEFLVENKSLYGILSVGIHSLDEQQCLAYFETVKVGIELILDEKVEQYKKGKKIEEAKQKLSVLTQQVKSNN